MERIERLGTGRSAANNAMRAARKFLDARGRPNYQALGNLDSVTKLCDLAYLDADDLEALDRGEKLPGIGDLQDIEEMSSRELRLAVRKERAARRADQEDADAAKEAQRERLAKKDRKIEGLEDELRFRNRQLEDYRTPGRISWTRRENSLLAAAALYKKQAEDLGHNLQAGITELQELAADIDGHRDSARVLNIDTVDRAARQLKALFAETIDLLGKEVLHLGDLISEPLECEKQAADDIQPWDLPASADGEEE